MSRIVKVTFDAVIKDDFIEDLNKIVDHKIESLLNLEEYPKIERIFNARVDLVDSSDNDFNPLKYSDLKWKDFRPFQYNQNITMNHIGNKKATIYLFHESGELLDTPSTVTLCNEFRKTIENGEDMPYRYYTRICDNQIIVYFSNVINSYSFPNMLSYTDATILGPIERILNKIAKDLKYIVELQDCICYNDTKNVVNKKEEEKKDEER